MGKPRTPNPTEGEGISKVAYWQLKEKVREVGKCIGFENGESYEEDKMLELEKYEKVLNRRININFYDSWKKIHENLKNNILNGILLHGGVEL